MNITTSNKSEMAKFLDFFSQPAFAEEIKFFADGCENPGPFRFNNSEGLFHSLLLKGNWVEDKAIVEYLANFFEIYTEYFQNLWAFAPNRALKMHQAVPHAKAIGIFEKFRCRIQRRESALPDLKFSLDQSSAH